MKHQGVLGINVWLTGIVTQAKRNPSQDSSWFFAPIESYIVPIVFVKHHGKKGVGISFLLGGFKLRAMIFILHCKGNIRGFVSIMFFCVPFCNYFAVVLQQ